MSAEMTDFQIDDISLNPKLFEDRDNDPAAVIVRMKGHDGKGHPFIMVLLERREKMQLMMRAYTAWLWEPYHPITDQDFENLPDLYQISFAEESGASEQPILHVRSACTVRDSSGVTFDVMDENDGVFMNYINLNAGDSAVLELLK